MRRAKKGPTEAELKLRSDLERARRELDKRKKEDVTSAPGVDVAALQGRVAELERIKERLSKLYFTQLDENRRRAERMRRILRALTEISADRDLDAVVARVAATIQSILGFRLVLVRLRAPGAERLEVAASVGLARAALETLEAHPIELDDFRSWLRPQFEVSHSYFIGHKDPFSKLLPPGYVPDLGRREPWEWHAEDVLLVPLIDGRGEVIGCFSVDDPADRLVPSREVIELLEVFATHAVVAIENARLDRQILDRTRTLEQADARMAEMEELKGRFVSTISQELRTPLTAIRGYTDLLLAAGVGEKSSERMEMFQHLLEEEVQRLTRLIESVVDLGRFDAANHRALRESVDLADLARDAASALAVPAAERKVELKVARELDDTRLEADPDQVRQLVLHLASHALKRSPVGGQVTLRIGGTADVLKLEVEDGGDGIPEESLGKILDRFDPFETRGARADAGGLDLAVCASIVDFHGGRMSARREPGRGTVIAASLPRRSSPRVIVRADSELSESVHDVARLGVEMVREVMDAGAVSLMSVDRQGDLIVQAAIGLDPQVVRAARVRKGVGVAGWVHEHRRPVCASGPQDSIVPGSGRPQYRTGTFLCVPLEAAGELLGVLNVTEPPSGRAFQIADCHLLLELAETIARAWRAARATEERRAGIATTRQALRTVLDHVREGRRRAPRRVALARAVTQELEVPADDASLVAFAAALHDVGMTLIDPEIVEGRGPLTAEQRNHVRRHIELGDRVLEHLETMGAEAIDGLETIHGVREIVLSHHEWWDGTGYPRGLCRTAIPIGARVLAIVDAFESLVTGRPHRPAESSKTAIATLEALSARQFDPDVVLALRRVLERGAWDPMAPTQVDAASHAGR